MAAKMFGTVVGVFGVAAAVAFVPASCAPVAEEVNSVGVVPADRERPDGVPQRRVPQATGALLTPAPAVAAPAPPPARPRPTTTRPPAPTAPSTARPPMAGWPNASNTGVVAGTPLAVVSGDQTFSASGQVIEGKDFHGFVRVTGSNITFRNCVFRGRAASGNAALLDTERGGNTVVENSEFVPSSPSATIDGIWAKNTSIYRSHIHGGVDGVKAQSNTLIQDSYIHDMNWFAHDPNQGGGETHNDGVQSFAGETNVTLRHNTIDLSTTRNGNAALQSSASNTRVENNLLDGGGCVLNFDHKSIGRPLTGIHLTGNRFGRHSAFRCPILVSTQTVIATNTGNVWSDDGQPIPPPQRHD